MLTDDYSPRSLATNLRTYCREKDGRLETVEECNWRSQYIHHEQLAGRNGKRLNPAELLSRADLGARRLSWVAGRTRFLGGTSHAATRAASQFNCAFLRLATVFDVVDAAWLLLNGCGVGFTPVVGTLHGSHKPYQVEVIPSNREAKYKGNEENLTESPSTGVLRILIGDSAAAWAKAIGKLFQLPANVSRLVLDFSECRGPGDRLAGYGWICNGYLPMATAMKAIISILHMKSGDLLDEIDIVDIINHVGSILSSRRSAQIALLDADSPRASQFAVMKKDYSIDNPQRRQSNNSLQFWSKPSRSRIEETLWQALACGGCPGIENASAARRKAPWFVGSNPCHEILLPSHGFCNLVTNCLPRFRKNYAALERAVHLIARANYRQTCVDLRDGILSPAWHQTNEALRLCGVSLTGICQADWLTDYQIRRLRNAAVFGAYSMADEWGMPRPKAVTTIKPEGTGTKAMGSSVFGEVTEGIHKPLGRYIFNWINFSIHDPLVAIYEASGYRTLPNPNDSNNVLICFPVEYQGVRFDMVGGMEVNLEPALVQLERYQRWNLLWADHTVSCTISYSPDEIPGIAEWVDRKWDDFISVAFILRNDPTKTARDLGHPYLPQEVQTAEGYRGYVDTLKPVKIPKDGLRLEDLKEDDCVTGVCPVR